MNKKLKYGLFSVLLFGSLSVGSQLSEAKSILEAPKTEVPTDSTVIASKYDFVASFNDKTTVKTFGDGWKETEVNGNGEFKAFTLRNPTDGLKGKTGVIYENVGIHNGKQIDLKITVEDWTDYNNKSRMISYTRDHIAHAISGFLDVKQTWEYVDHETGKSATDLKGSFITINDIDYLQHVIIDKDTFNDVEKMFVSSDSWLDYQDKDGGVLIQDVSGKGSTSSDPFAMVTVLFNSNKFTFSWGADLVKGGESQDAVFEEDWGGGAYFSFLGTKPARTELVEPTKTVTDSDEENVESNTLTSQTEEYKYTIYAPVTDESSQFYYKDYTIKDSLIKELQPTTDIKVFDEADKDVTSYFDNQSKDNDIVLTAKKDMLGKAEFYGHTYKVEFGVKVRDGADLSAYTSEDGTITIPNTATVVRGDESKNTNPTNTAVKPTEKPAEKPVEKPIEKPTPVENSIEKYIKQDGKNETEVNANFLDTVDFVLPVQIGNNGGVTSSTEDSSSTSSTEDSSSTDSTESSSSDSTNSTGGSEIGIGNKAVSSTKESNSTTDSTTNSTNTMNKELKKVVIIDDLDEKVFDVKQDTIKVYSSDEKDVTGQFDIGFEKDTQKITVTAKEPDKWLGKQLVVTFSATIKEGTFEDYLKDGKYQFFNVGSLQVDDNKLDSKPVQINVEKKPDKETGELPQTGTDNKKQIGTVLLVSALLGSGGYAVYYMRKKGEN